jgi:hypothetical protein
MPISLPTVAVHQRVPVDQHERTVSLGADRPRHHILPFELPRWV